MNEWIDDAEDFSVAALQAANVPGLFNLWGGDWTHGWAPVQFLPQESYIFDPTSPLFRLGASEPIDAVLTTALYNCAGFQIQGATTGGDAFDVTLYQGQTARKARSASEITIEGTALGRDAMFPRRGVASGDPDRFLYGGFAAGVDIDLSYPDGEGTARVIFAFRVDAGAAVIHTIGGANYVGVTPTFRFSGPGIAAVSDAAGSSYGTVGLPRASFLGRPLNMTIQEGTESGLADAALHITPITW